MSLDTLRQHLDHPGQAKLQGLAPAAGLSLVRVSYA